MKQFILLVRGKPGTNRSHLAETLSKVLEVPHLQNKMFHDGSVNGSGNCISAANHLLNEYDGVIINNRFETRAHIDPYLQLAKRFGLKFGVINATEVYNHKYFNDFERKTHLPWDNIPNEIKVNNGTSVETLKNIVHKLTGKNI